MKHKTLKFTKKEIADLTKEEQNTIIGGNEITALSCDEYACPDTVEYCLYTVLDECPGHTYDDPTCACAPIGY